MAEPIQDRPQEWPACCKLAAVGTVALFTIWGLAQPVYANLAPLFSSFFTLQPVQAAVTQSMLGATYFLLAIPGALVLRQFGYKIGIILGLGGFAGGAFLLYPAITQHDYTIFLAAVIVMGGGYALLETGANPLIMLMGTPRNAVLRLNFAQSFYPVGLIAGVYATQALMASTFHNPVPYQMQVAVRPYLLIGLALVLLAFLVDHMHFPRLAFAAERKRSRARDEFRSLLFRPLFRFAMAAQAAAIAAQTWVWSLIPVYLHDRLPGTAISAADVLLWSWIAYAAGRFAGTALMTRCSPERLLALFAASGVTLAAVAAGTGGSIGLACLVGTSFFLSIMFPTIFGTAVRDTEPFTKSASGLIVVSSGFGVTAAMAALNIGLPDPSLVFLAGAGLCLAVVLAYAMAGQRAHEPEGTFGHLFEHKVHLQ